MLQLWHGLLMQKWAAKVTNFRGFPDVAWTWSIATPHSPPSSHALMPHAREMTQKRPARADLHCQNRNLAPVDLPPLLPCRVRPMSVVKHTG